MAAAAGGVRALKPETRFRGALSLRGGAFFARLGPEGIERMVLEGAEPADCEVYGDPAFLSDCAATG